jgi:SAM-dependent methyltransferase
MAGVYRHRPPYPEQTFELLLGLIDDGAPDTCLDIGAGTGDLARPLAQRLARIDAIEPSGAMVQAGQALEHGRHPSLCWQTAPIEAAQLDAPYGLAVAGESLHWTNWDLTFPRIAAALAPGAVLALVGRGEAPKPWDTELRTLIARYSTNRDFAPYDLIEELESRGHFEVLGRARTDDVPFSQSREEFIDALHSRNGFSRTRMGVVSKVFDAKFRDLLFGHGVQDSVSFGTWAEIVWGRPL